MRIKILLFCLCPIILNAQTIWENPKSEIYPYLYRLAQKGIVSFQDIIQPVSRQNISAALLEAESKVSELSEIEKKELAFYLQEYGSISTQDSTTRPSFFKQDENKRFRSMYIHHKDFQMNVDPIISAMLVSGTSSNFTQRSWGFNFNGQSKKIGFQFYYREYTESGSGIDTFRKESPETGIIKLYSPSTTQYNYSDIRCNINYGWKTGSLSLGKDYLLWGYGENGRVILSDKAPSYPYIRFDFSPFKWLRFNYFNAWLNSNIVDSTRSYPTNSGGVSGNERIVFIPKFMASHTLIFTPLKGLDIAVGESIVYSDNLDIGFLIPINFFKIYDNNKSNYVINAGSNGQFFLQLSSKNHIKKTHLYSSLFIDEIRVSEVFNKEKSRNQLGYTIGGSITDAFIHYLTIGAEYTRVNPFVYSNLIPAQNYTQYDSPLGDWMGNNFDRSIFFLKYTPTPRLRTYFRYEYIRKGGPGTLQQQYLSQPQPPFLFDFQKNRGDLFFQITYEIINNLYFTGNYQYVKENLAGGVTAKGSTMQIGVTYGLK